MCGILSFTTRRETVVAFHRMEMGYIREMISHISVMKLLCVLSCVSSSFLSAHVSVLFISRCLHWNSWGHAFSKRG